MRTEEEYIKGLGKMRRNIYFDGELIDRTDERQMNCLKTIGTTFDEAAKPENEELCTAISHLTGQRTSRFTHIHQNTDDLHRKQDMTRMLCQKVGGCIQRCMGIDATNAIYNVSYEADKSNNGATQYHENFKKWLTRFQTEDLVGCCAQTDVKGDRLLRPADQPDPTSMSTSRNAGRMASSSAAVSCTFPKLLYLTRCSASRPARCAPRTRTTP